jgi:hypothetical protein
MFLSLQGLHCPSGLFACHFLLSQCLLFLTFDTISFLAFAQLFALEQLLLQLEVMQPPASSPAFVLNFCRSILFQCLILLHVMRSRIQWVLERGRNQLFGGVLQLGDRSVGGYIEVSVLA